MTALEIIQLIAVLEPGVLDLVGMLIAAIDAGHAPQTVAQAAADITAGIRADHPDWPEAQVARYAADALAVWKAKQ